MTTYRFRVLDSGGDVIVVHYVSLGSDAEARQHADTTFGEYDCACVEAWVGDRLVCAIKRPTK
jgi:hypothetical protein